jgi:hypothetical protein
MIRGLEGEKLDGWLEEAEASEVEVMKSFGGGGDEKVRHRVKEGP